MTGPEPVDAVAERVAAAAQTVPGLSLLVPLRRKALAWTAPEASLAVTVDTGGIEIRLAADRLPLPPLLDQVQAAVRAALAGIGWESAPLRLVVAELSASAFRTD